MYCIRCHLSSLNTVSATPFASDPATGDPSSFLFIALRSDVHSVLNLIEHHLDSHKQHFSEVV